MSFNLKLHEWWGLDDPGSKDIELIEMADGKFQLIKTVKSLIDNKVISETKWDISKDDVKMVKDFIIKNKLNKKKFKANMIFDAGFDVGISMDGIVNSITNDTDVYDELKDVIATIVGRKLL